MQDREYKFDEIVDTVLLINSNKEDNTIEINQIKLWRLYLIDTYHLDVKTNKFSGNDFMKLVIETEMVQLSLMSIMRGFGFSAKAVEELKFCLLTYDGIVRFNIDGSQFLNEVDPYYRWAINGNNKD